MRKTGFFITLSSFALAAAGLAAIGANQPKKAEVVEGRTLSSDTLILELSDSRWYRDSIAIYFFDSTESAWGPRIDAPSQRYYEYDISGLEFVPTGCIVSNFYQGSTPASWCLDWDNGGVYSRTTDIDLTGDTDVIWVGNNYTDSKSCYFGTYSLDSYLVGDYSDGWTEEAFSEQLSSFKISKKGHLELYGEVELDSGTYFKIKTGHDGAMYGSYSCNDLIKGNLSGVNGYIYNEESAKYEFYFDYTDKTVYINNPALAAADEWAQDFLGANCQATMSNWSTALSDFESLSSEEAKDVLSKHDHIPQTEQDPEGFIAQAMQRYDYIIIRYGVYDAKDNPTGKVDFMKRVENGYIQFGEISNGRISYNYLGETSTLVPILVIISLLSVTAIGAFLFLKNRKENN